MKEMTDSCLYTLNTHRQDRVGVGFKRSSAGSVGRLSAWLAEEDVPHLDSQSTDG